MTRPHEPRKAEPGKIWHRYAAIGDSFTEGMSDPDPDVPDRYVGWADRLAAHLAQAASSAGEEFRYANLAVRGRLLDDIVGPQLDAALELGPDLVSMVGGGNDILRAKVDLDSIAQRIEEAVVRLRATGAEVLLATPVDPVEAPVIKRTRGRSAVYTANLHAIAQRHGAYVIDLWSIRPLRDGRMWAEDRIHLTTEGHRRVALAALDALGHEADRADFNAPLPPAPALSRRETAAANAAWAREYFGPWVQRRLQGRSSGDAISPKRPTLEPLDPAPLEEPTR